MRSFFFLLSLLSSIAALAQSSVQGTVIDSETNTPLPGATVFIANTTKGVSSDVDGVFRIEGLQSVHYQLVISFVGYGTQVIEIVPEQPVTYRILLTPVARVLNEVVIRAGKQSRKEWLANFRIFKDHFIGLSENADRCVFENPDVVYFDKQGSKLLAFADSILSFENRGLGYRVKVLLQRYEYSPATTRLHYEGPMVFEPLTPASDKEKERWAKNRLRAYYGSQMHFFRALYNRKLNKEGFYFFMKSTKDTDSIKTARSPVFNNRRIKIRTITNYNYIVDSTVMKFDGELEVLYINESESKDYQTDRRLPIQKNMQLSKLVSFEPAIIQPDGQSYPVGALQFSGYWSWELMSESLPLDYEPKADLEIIKK